MSCTQTRRTDNQCRRPLAGTTLECGSLLPLSCASLLAGGIAAARVGNAIGATVKIAGWAGGKSVVLPHPLPLAPRERGEMECLARGEVECLARRVSVWARESECLVHTLSRGERASPEQGEGVARSAG